MKHALSLPDMLRRQAGEWLERAIASEEVGDQVGFQFRMAEATRLENSANLVEREIKLELRALEASQRRLS